MYGTSLDSKASRQTSLVFSTSGSSRIASNESTKSSTRIQTHMHARTHHPRDAQIGTIAKENQLLPCHGPTTLNKRNVIHKLAPDMAGGQTFWPTWRLCYADSVTSNNVISQANENTNVRNAICVNEKRYHPACRQRFNSCIIVFVDIRRRKQTGQESPTKQTPRQAIFCKHKNTQTGLRKHQ